MAEIRPLRALHYDLSTAGGLADVVAPPYDVIDAEMRKSLVDRSAFNVVGLDLPEGPAGADRYLHAAQLLEAWTLQGTLQADRDESLWALEQDYEGPDGERHVRRGFLCRVRVTDYGPGKVRPHERTQPGPKEDRLRLTQATRHNLSPIFSLHEGNAWPHLEAATEGEPWGEATDDTGTVNRVWKITDAEVIEAVTSELADAELLIADGHHRYETARTYADTIGGEGEHRYTLMALVSLEDPGLTVFGYHRLLTDLSDESKREALRDTLTSYFDLTEVPLEELDPAGAEGVGVFGYADSHHKQGYRLTLKDPALLSSELGNYSDAYRRLDAAILEALVLRGALGMSAADVEAKRGIAYTASAEEATSRLGEDVDAVFLMRPTPVEDVREVAAAGETMPPKSTYFFPKLPTGLVFNPLE